MVDPSNDLPPLPLASHLIAWSIPILAGSSLGYLALRDSWITLPALAVAVLGLSGLLCGIVLSLVDPDTRRTLAAWNAANDARKQVLADEAEESEASARVIAQAVAEIQAADSAGVARDGTTGAEARPARKRRTVRPKTIRTKVVGVTFRNYDGTDRQEIIATHCRVGTPLRIEHEPYNPRDPFAVAVLVFGLQIGYLRSELAEDVLGRLEAGMTATVEVLDVTGIGRRGNLGVNIRIDLS